MPVTIDGLTERGGLLTERLWLKPLTADELRRAKRNFSAYAGCAGLKAYKQRLLRRFERHSIYRSKLSLLHRHPDALLYCSTWLMVERNGLKIVGEAGFKGPPSNGMVEIGYYTEPVCRSQGFMTEAVKALCDFARGDGRIKYVTALTEKRNIASRRVLEKCGFRRAGFKGRYNFWSFDTA